MLLLQIVSAIALVFFIFALMGEGATWARVFKKS